MVHWSIFFTLLAFTQSIQLHNSPIQLSLSELKLNSPLEAPARSKVYIIENRIGGDRKAWLNQVDLDSASASKSTEIGKEGQYAYEQTVWRLDDQEIMIVTWSFDTQPQYNITTVNINTMEQTSVESIEVWWQTAVLDQRRGSFYVVKTSENDNHAIVMDVNPVNGQPGNVSIRLLGGVPTFHDFTAAYDPKNQIYYVVGYFDGPVEANHLEQRKFRDCFSGSCVYLYTVDMAANEQTDVHYLDDQEPIEYLFYHPPGDELIAFVMPPFGSLHVAKFMPTDASFLMIAEIHEIECAVDMFYYDEKSGTIIFTAVADCDDKGSVIVTYDIKLATYKISAHTMDTVVTEGATLFI